MSIRTLLVANRGEIAVRIVRTCRRLGIRAVAAVAPGDERSLHARVADDTVCVASYLDAGGLVRAATRAGADAIHPGYGFVAESAELALAASDAGLRFVGPSAEVLRRAGDKLESKRIAAAAGVPVLPTGDAEDVGFPLLVKAAAGGGGRGMRVVRTCAELDEALASAAREASAAFGDGTVYLERYLERPRHVEVQILADAHGNAVSLGERDCSVQRRHQKLLEEAPAPGLDDELRSRLEASALTLARALGYENAGTVEFLVAGDEYVFLELNARIQVEHPVTEAVTGLDLVEWQLRIADGEPVPEPPSPRGHAVEARLYAEHPRTFAPQAGVVRALSFPDTVRVDAGVEAGDEIPARYDALLAKLVAHAGTRELALDRLSAALSATSVEGVVTNLPFLRWLLDHPRVRAGTATTGLLEEHPPLSRTRAPRGPFRGYFRLNRDPNLPAPPAAAPPQVEETSRHAIPGAHRAAELVAPTPGTVLRVLVREGDAVRARDPLIVLEAMKMETPLLAPYDAVVVRLNAAEGDQVPGGAVLAELAADGETRPRLRPSR